MHKPCVIVIEYETREHLKDVAKKNQTYDGIINELISLKENKNENVIGKANFPTTGTHHISKSEVSKYG